MAFGERKGRIEAEAEAQALRTALSAMVTDRFTVMPEDDEVSWARWESPPMQCSCRPSPQYLAVREKHEHAWGCPVPAAEKALGTKGETTP